MKKNRGITLVALVITVIVLLILAGVGISLITGSEGIFGNAKQAAEEHNNAAEKEAELINELIDNINMLKDPNKTIIGNGNYNTEMGVNTPKLLAGMEPVIIGEDGNTSKATTEKEWYDYSTNSKRWANAQTKDGSLWVWIPRYAYKIPSGLGTSTTGKIDVVFVDTKNKKGETTYRTTYPTVTGNAMDDYVVHPAFVDGKANNFENGEWDSDIPGFWVAKFEAGYAGGGKNDANNDVPVVDTELKYSGSYSSINNYYGAITSGSTTMKYPVFMGKSFSYNYINTGDIYKLSRSLAKEGNPYGFNASADSHLIKNSEWGAVVYLSHSQYGVNGENTVYINNVNLNNKLAIYGVTGYAGANINATENLFSNAPSIFGDSLSNGTVTSYAWNTGNGVKASSNNNITGVYDLSGGNWEYAAGYINNTGGTTSRTNYGGTLIGETDKYRKIYPHNSTSDTSENNWIAYKNIKGFGDGILETSSSGSGANSWNSDYSNFQFSSNPFSIRGGNYSTASSAGLFSFRISDGQRGGSGGFRVVLIEN